MIFKVKATLRSEEGPGIGGAHPLVPALMRQRQKGPCAFKARMVYKARSRKAWAITQRNPHFKKPRGKKVVDRIFETPMCYSENKVKRSKKILICSDLLSWERCTARDSLCILCWP